MKHSKRFLVMLLALCLCGTIAACGSPAGNTGGNSTQTSSVTEDSRNEETPEAVSETEAADTLQTEPVTEDSRDEETPEAEPETEAADTIKTANIGIIAWSLGMGDESEFVEAVQTALSEQHSDQINAPFVMDAIMGDVPLSMILENMIAMWEGEKAVILIVNDKDGFSDEELLSLLKDAEKANVITGVDHIIDGAPESTFVYDMSDAAGCASMIMENASN